MSKDAHNYDVNAAISNEGYYKIELHDDVILLAVRNTNGKHWCGYVGVPKSHPWFGKDYMDIKIGIPVHGGLTFAGNEPAGFSDPNMNWWFLGFDCAHHMDWSEFSPDGIYRDLPYVWKEMLAIMVNSQEALAEEVLSDGKK